MKKRAGRADLRAKYIAVAVTAAFAPLSVYGQTPPPANQLPSLTLTQGSGNVNAPVGTFLQVDQFSQRAIFSGSMTMGSAGHMNVSQPGSSAIGLFRDTTGGLTQIFGRITANGQIFLSNPNGVLMGNSARIEVGGLFATNLSITDTDFMDGRYKWFNSGATGGVTNQGEIITPSGYAVLAGPQVRNDGLIVARTGTVVLAAGDRVSLDMIGDGLISVSVDQAALNASVVNTGNITAEGGTVLLTTRSANALLDTVVNAGGVIRATSLIERNGEIVLDGGSAGAVLIAGNHNAGSSSVRGANVTVNGTIVTDLGSGTQTVTTPGALTIDGVGASASNSGFIHQGSGEQRIEAGNLFMTGGTGVGTNAVITSSDANADQKITVSGNLLVKGGPAGDGNQAIIRSAGNQIIDGNATITVEGGANSGPGGNNTAFIIGAASNAPGKKQTINAGSITMRSGAGGVQNGAVILGPKQEITTSGDVLLAGGGTGGPLGGVRMGGLSTGAGGAVNTPTDLTLTVGNDLLLRGGATPANSANIGSTTGQAQTVNITAARDVIINDTAVSASRIGTFVAAGPQNGTPGGISVAAGRDIKVNGGGEIFTTGTVTLKALNGAVTVDASSPSAAGARVQSGAGQDIQAQSVSVTAANNRSAQIINTGGEQSVKAGTLEVQTLGAAGGLAEVRNNGIGDQKLTLSGDHLTVRSMGGGTAIITGNGNQTIDMTRVGPKTVTVGDNAAQGLSTITSNGEQKVLGYADINITGGSGPNGATSSIQASNPGATQRVEANNLTLANSTLGGGGNGSVAGIFGAKQAIHALGNVTLTANASGGTLPGVRIGGLGGGGTSASATDLTLTVGGNLELKGSNTTANNGVGIGTSGASGTPALANKITIDAGGNVILTAGSQDKSGVRIGTSTNTTTGTGPGDISIKAGGSIELNGSAQTASIRTTGNVSLEAASISEGTNGLILADTLTTKTTGTTNLAGPNDVAKLNATSGGPLTFVDAGTLQVTGISTTNDAITLTTDSLSNTGLITNGGSGNIVLSANAFNLAGGTIDGGGAAVILRPRTGTNSFGIESFADTMLSNADLASIRTSDFVVLGSGTGTIFTGNMLIGQNARVEGEGKHLAFFRSSTPGGTTTIGVNGVNTSGNMIVSAGGGAIVSQGGSVSANQVQLRASQGIGSDAARVQTSANRLALNNSGPQGAFVVEAGDVTLGNVNLTVGGLANNVTNTIGGGGPYNVLAGGSITVSDVVQAGSVALNTPSGSITETGAGAILAGSLTTSSTLDTSLTGANQLASFNGAILFGGTGGIAVNNTGALNVTGLTASGNATLTNNGAVTVSGSWTSSGATNIVTTGGDLTVTTNTLRSTGAMEFDVGGRLVLSANGPQSAVVTGMAGQTVRAQGVEITSQNGGFASLEAQGGDQRITVNGGSVDVQVLSGSGAAQIVGPAGRTQTVEVINGDHIAVNGRGNSSFAAIITGPTGTQEVSITGSGANALRLGSTGGGGFSEIVAGSQQVTAGAEGQNGSITIVGSSVNGRFAGISTQPTTGGTQDVSTSGLLRVTGGNAPGQNLNAGLFHGGGGEQKVNAARIELVAGSTGSGNGAMIVSNGGNVPGNTAGAQTVTASGDIVIESGAGGNANITAGPTRLQKIRAHDISMTNALAGGTDSVASISGGLQDIHATGNLTMTARGAAGNLPGIRIGGLSGTGSTSTNLKLTVDGDLTMTGGTGNNGVGIGTTAAPPAGATLSNNITIDARDVILTGGTGPTAAVRIGASGAPGVPNFAGDIRITARDIKLNVDAQPGAQNAAIRTLGNVTLDAASISEGSGGLVVADKLTTSTTGATNLGGANDIKRFEATSGGPLTLVDAGSLQVLGVATTNDTITLTTDSLTNAGVITNGGPTSTANIIFNANSYNLAGGTVEGGAAAVILRPRTGTNSFGIEADAQTTLTNADIGSIHTSDFVVFGSGMGTTFTGDMVIGRNATVDGGGKNLAFFRSSQPGGSTTIGIGGVSTTGNVIVSAGGGKIVSEGGTVSGDQVQLRASHGIGDQFMRVQTAANRLAINNFGPESAYVFETGDVTLGNVNLTVGGIPNNVTNTVGGGGAYDVLAGGSITVSDLIQAGSVALGASNGSITEIGAGAIIANDLRTFSGQSTLLGGANQVGVLSASAGGDVLLNNTGLLNVTSLNGQNVTVANIGDMTLNGFWNSTGATTITTAGAGSDLTVSNSTVFSQGAMTLSVDGVLTVAASGLQVIPPPPGLPPLPPVPNFAFLTSSGGQNITARSILLSATGGGSAQIVSSGGNQTLTATSGGVDLQSTGAGSFAQLTNNGANQTIDATGGMRLRAQGGSAQVSNTGTGDQSIAVNGGGLNLTGDAAFAGIANAANSVTTPGMQIIRVSGGAGIDMQALNGGGTSVIQSAPGREQKILVTNADHIKLDNTGGSAFISTNGGTQTVSITGGGANAIVLGTTGGRAFAGIANGNIQNVTAGNEGEQGSITITGGAVNGQTASIVSRTATDGTQTVSTGGLIRVVGGTATSQTNSAGIFHSGSGEQKVSAARIELEGGASGNNNGALIASSGGGVPANGGAQTVTVTGDIVIAGGAGGNAGISGPAARQQTIRAHNIEMTNSALGGNNSVGLILGGHQDIHATGNVTMTARASGGDLPGVRIGGLSANNAIGFAGTGTDLKLVVDGNLTLNGSTTTANNGVGIGTSAAVGTPAFDNRITIEAGGNVVLNAGTFEGSGVRIGTSTNTGTGTGGGDISITAGGTISLNGTAQAAAAIRTRGDVALEAAAITEAGRGLIEANALTTRSSGDTQLGGPNSVSAFTAESDHGNVLLRNTSALLTLGSMDLPGNLQVAQTGDVTIGSATATEGTLVAAAGDVSMSASGQILVRGSDTTIGAASAVLAGGELSFIAGDVTLRAGDAALTPVVVRGADGVEMTVGRELKVTAGGLLSPSLLTSGRNIDLTIGQALRIDGNGPFSLARVQTESRDGVISISFPSLTSGGYFVDGVEGSVHHGQTGFFTDFKAAKVGRTLLLEYGN